MRNFEATAKCLSRPVILEAKRRGSIRFFLTFLLTIALAACGGDSGTSANDDNVSSSSSSSVIPASSGNRLSSSSKKIASSSSTPRNDVKSSSSNKALSSSSKRSDGDPSSSSQKITSSSSVIPASSGNLPSSSSKKDGGSSSAMTNSSSSSKEESSSSEYVPFDHSNTLASDWYVGENAYKKFTDPRNGRSYYYLKIIGKRDSGRKDSVTIMAENLNIGKMVLGTEDQKDDKVIERYCYNNDTTKCDEFGGLYQWAEMMQLPSRCNTESCADLIEENHRGICPEGWRLMTYKDFYIAWHAESNDHGIEGVRSSYGFNGYNSTGLSLTGAGLRTDDGKFEDLKGGAYWFLPKEFEGMELTYAHSGFVASDGDYAPTKNDKDTKLRGSSVRCVKVGD